MFKIDPDTFYTKQDLITLFGDTADIETFLSKVQPHKVLRTVYRGKDLLRAWDRCVKHDIYAEPLPKRKVVKRDAKNHPQEDRISLDKVLAHTQ
jgi:hypothetical protein